MSDIRDILSVEDVKDICDALENAERKRRELESEVVFLRTKLISEALDNDQLRQSMGAKDLYIAELELAVLDLSNELTSALTAVVTAGTGDKKKSDVANSSATSLGSSLTAGISIDAIAKEEITCKSSSSDSSAVVSSGSSSNCNSMDYNNISSRSEDKSWTERIASLRENYSKDAHDELSPDRYLYLSSKSSQGLRSNISTTNNSTKNSSISRRHNSSRPEPPSEAPPPPPPTSRFKAASSNNSNTIISINSSNNSISNSNGKNSNGNSSSNTNGHLGNASESAPIRSPREIVQLQDFDDVNSD